MRRLLAASNTRIGLLGGSFNPPHCGHLNISLQTLKKFNLSKVFWLVTPCSPAKNPSVYESFNSRVQKCLDITKDYSNKIHVLDIEKSFRNFYSSNTIKEIKKQLNGSIYWIMGSDNLLQIHKWHKWKSIFRMTKVVVCERTLTTLQVRNAKASHNFQPWHLSSLSHVKEQKDGFYIFHTKKTNTSSTQIRTMLS